MRLALVFSISIVMILWSDVSYAEKAKYETALAADIWNSFTTPQDLETFLSVGKSKADKIVIKKIMSHFSKKLSPAVFANGAIQFGVDKTQWALDSERGVWINDKLFVPKTDSSIIEQIQQLRRWEKETQKTSLLNIWIQPAYAADPLAGLAVDERTAAQLFTVEMNNVLNMSCFQELEQETLKKRVADKKVVATLPKSDQLKPDFYGIICSDQNPEQETIFATASGGEIIYKMRGQFSQSKTPGKTFLKKAFVEVGGEHRTTLNFIDLAPREGSELHTMEVKFRPGGPATVLDKNQVKGHNLTKCDAEMTQRMLVAVNKVCANVKASSFIQQQLGQTSGPKKVKQQTK